MVVFEVRGLVCGSKHTVVARKEDIERMINALGNSFNVVLIHRITDEHVSYMIYVVDTNSCLEVVEFTEKAKK